MSHEPYHGLQHADLQWLALVQPDKQKQQQCILCGGYISGPRKVLRHEILEGVTSHLKQVLPHNPIVSAFHNVVQTAIQIQDDHNGIFFSCGCCQHWFEKRLNRSLPLLPLLSFIWHIQVLANEGQKPLDARPIHRLSKTLCQKRHGKYVNFYRTLFTADELKLIEKISNNPSNAIENLISAHYHTQSVDTFLVSDAKLAEILRENRPHACDLNPHGVKIEINNPGSHNL